MEAAKYIKNLEKEANESKQKLEEFKKLQQLYPDLEVQYNRWKTPRYCSKMVNATADHSTIGYSCGCCDDAAKLFYMWTEVEGAKVFTNPYCVVVGEGRFYPSEYFFGDEESLKKHDITSPKILEQLTKEYDEYLESRKERSRYDYMEDDNDY